MDRKPIGLLPEDFEQDTWRRLSEVLAARLNQYRIDNDAGNLDDIKTARLRGRIAEIKDLLALEPSPDA